MFRRIYRQRRRIAVFALGNCIAIAAVLFPDMAELYDVHEVKALFWLTEVVFFGLCAAVLMAVASLWVLVFPRYRNLVEMVGLTIAVLALLNALLPGSAVARVPGADLALLVLVLYPVFALRNGKFLTNLTLTVGSSPRTTVFNQPAEVVWASFVPGEGPVSGYRNRALQSVTPAADEPGALDMRFQYGAGPAHDERVRFIERHAPTRAVYEETADLHLPAADRHWHRVAVTITALGMARCALTITEDGSRIPLGAAIDLWFDDGLNDLLDDLQARLDGGPNWSLTARFAA